MKKRLVFCLLPFFGMIWCVSSVWAIDVGWMQKGVRVWYLGGVGSGTSSNAEEAYLFDSVEGDSVQVTHHSAINHWSSPNAPNTEMYPLSEKGPCWIHPQTLQNIEMGDYWMGYQITLVVRSFYTYSTLPYALLPAKALFDLKPQREIVKLSYMIAGFSVGNAYFDSETGILLQYHTMWGGYQMFFILSEINYDFARQVVFAEDEGPHTGFKSFVSEQSMNMPGEPGGGSVIIQSLVETRYGATIEMRTLTSYSGPTSGLKNADENYCFFGSIPILRRMDATQATNFLPELWDPFGEYLWWWVPPAALKKQTIVIFNVPMEKISTQPYVFSATESPERFFFTKIWFGNDGYMTAFSAKDATIGLDVDPDNWIFQNSTTVEGLDYYRNTMGKAMPDTVPGDVDGDFDLDLADAILSLRILAGFELSQGLGDGADVNRDGKIGTEEIIWVLQRISVLR